LETHVQRRIVVPAIVGARLVGQSVAAVLAFEQPGPDVAVEQRRQSGPYTPRRLLADGVGQLGDDGRLRERAPRQCPSKRL